MPIAPPPDIQPEGDNWEFFDRALTDLADQMGWDSWSDIINFTGDEIDYTNIRPGQYATPQDAIFNAYDMGILGFSYVVYDIEYDAYYLVVGDSGGTA